MNTTKGFTQLVKAIEDMMQGPANTNTTGITLHRDLGWCATYQASDINAEDEIAIVYKNDIIHTSHCAEEEIDAHVIAEWIRDNVVMWICDAQDRLDEHGIKNARLTRAEIEAHLA
jgi:hypothetical protein